MEISIAPRPSIGRRTMLAGRSAIFVRGRSSSGGQRRPALSVRGETAQPARRVLCPLGPAGKCPARPSTQPWTRASASRCNQCSSICAPRASVGFCVTLCLVLVNDPRIRGDRTPRGSKGRGRRLCTSIRDFDRWNCETCRYVSVYVDSGSKVLELELFRPFILIARQWRRKKRRPAEGVFFVNARTHVAGFRPRPFGKECPDRKLRRATMSR
ncbi:uncharacterized protein LOC143178227 [Calliopsis andreniformis]|uniref:uncharacterized protein LOC143178227 n=1 Tax=Calliopsis andreniformis TaxID=337506 RepID=UPI003FCDF0C2